MEAIKLFYNTSPSGSDTDDSRRSTSSSPPLRKQLVRYKSHRTIYRLKPLPPPELDDVPIARIPGSRGHGGRKRSFAHVDGNYPAFVQIPIPVTISVRNVLEPMLRKASSMMPALRGMDDDCIIAARRGSCTGVRIAREYHISLSKTAPIRVQQIETLIPILRHKFESQSRFWIEFGKFEVFVNEDATRTFLGLEIITAGLSEVRRQIALVTEVFKIHALPPFYDPPRPHISVAWALGDVSSDLQRVADRLNEWCGNNGDYGTGLNNVLWTHLFAKMEAKIGQQTYPVWYAGTASHT